MQLTSASILGMPSNLSRSSANSPAATIAQRDARGSATDCRPDIVAEVLPVRTPAGFRFMPPALHMAPSKGASGTGGSSSVSAIGKPQAIPANARGPDVVNSVRADLHRVHSANAFAKDRLSPFGRVHVTTSVSSLIAVLAKQSFLGLDNPNLAQPEPIAVIPELKLRALFMKALVWFINRECPSLDGAVVVFVGKRARGNTSTTRLALPFTAVHKLADEFITPRGDQEFDLELEEVEAHSALPGNFYVEHSHWAIPIAGVLGIVGLCVLVFLCVFLRDVATLLGMLPPAF